MDRNEHIRHVVRRIDRPTLIGWAAAAIGVIPVIVVLAVAGAGEGACCAAPFYFVGCITLGVMVSWYRRANIRSVVEGHCAVCGYNLASLPKRATDGAAPRSESAITCPECGMINSREHLGALTKALDE